MQSQRRNPGSYYSKQQLINSAFNQKQPKRKSVETQTQNLPNFGKLYDFNDMSLKEIKEIYVNTIDYLNSCHGFMNTVLGVETKKSGDFKIPEVTNYFPVLEMILKQRKSQNSLFTLQDSSIEVSSEASTNKIVDNGNSGSAERISFDFQQPLANCNDNIIINKGKSEQMNESTEAARNNKAKKSISPSRLVQSERSIPRKSSPQELKALSSTFEEILKTCNEFEHKSIEYLIKNDVPLNEPSSFHCKSCKPIDNIIKFENMEQGDQKSELSILESDEFLNIKHNTSYEEPLDFSIQKNQDKGFNLLAYALKHCTNPLPKSKSLGLIPSQQFSNVLLNFQEVTSKRSSLTVLNQAPQCRNPKKVNEMFQKISRESLREPGVDNLSLSISLEEVNEIDNDVGSYKGNDHVSRSISSESIILTDEEFQKRNTKSVEEAWSRENVQKQRYRPGSDPKNSTTAPVKLENQLKCNPFKLTNKDKSVADANILRTIGLFTEKGDIRPGIISILEEKQRNKNVARNLSKNLKFRTERKYDVEVRYNNRNMITGESEESLSDRNSIPDVDGMARSVSSCSTISDSDVLNHKAKQ